MSAAEIARSLAKPIAAFIRAGMQDDVLFGTLACQVFAYQFAENAAYRQFCLGHGISPADVRVWSDIPAAPAAAFKRFTLSCAPESECIQERGGVVFHSSGTTGSETSRHYLDRTALELYRTSLNAGFRRFVDPGGPERRLLALMPGAADQPHSSLSFMVESLAVEYGGAEFFWRPGWQENLASAIRRLTGPATLFGTAFAWIQFFDEPGSDGLALPAGSIVVETGGFKGRSREVSRDELYALFEQRFGVPSTHSVSEYGMSEMASQYYDSTLIDYRAGRTRAVRKIGPHWLRTRIVDPITGADAGPGQPGLLAHYDLANLNSVLAIRTDDYGIAAEDGGFLLLGRAPGAALRGCSLTAEDLMAAPAP